MAVAVCVPHKTKADFRAGNRSAHGGWIRVAAKTTAQPRVFFPIMTEEHYLETGITQGFKERHAIRVSAASKHHVTFEFRFLGIAQCFREMNFRCVGEWQLINSFTTECSQIF